MKKGKLFLRKAKAGEVAKVAAVESRSKASVGQAKTAAVMKASRLDKKANFGSGLVGFSSSMASASVPAGGGYGGGASRTVEGGGGNYYSPELSTDFLELPQSIDELRQHYRFFYRTDPIIGQAIDIHTDLPLSKVRLSRPDRGDRDMADAAMRFCEQWVKDVGLDMRLEEILHELNLLGEVYGFAEDTNDDMPEDVTHDLQDVISPEGQLAQQKTRRDDANERALKWMKKHYRGWTSIRVLPPEQIHHDFLPFSGEEVMEYIPDSKMKSIWEAAAGGDDKSTQLAENMPVVAQIALEQNENIPLNTDPDAGSFCFYLANKRSQYEPRGHSRLERCLRTIIFKDKLRQAQTSIASRHMTPIRVVSAEGLSEFQIEELRDQIDQALADPDYSIVTNFQVQWEEMNSNGRLLDLASEYDLINRELYAGLGVTESLLSGESSYSGDRINLEVINVRYMHVRQKLQFLVNEKLFKPMCRRMGFLVEEDEREYVVYPKLSFTRMAIRDNQDTYDAMFNLYSKGSLPVSTILDLLNIDPVTAREELERDFLTMNDPNFNEALRSIYSRVGDLLVEESNVKTKVAEYLNLDMTTPSSGEDRYR